MLISLVGMMGCGKSSTLRLLSQKIDNVHIFYEPMPETDNFILKSFYKEPKKFAYPMQTLMLGLHHSIQLEAIEYSNSGIVSIMDSAIYCGIAYVDTHIRNKLMNDIEYRAYKVLYDTMCNSLKKPDIIFVLDVMLDEVINRINYRKREYESGVDKVYLSTLYDCYNNMVKNMENNFNIIHINGMNSIDHVSEDIINHIRSF